MNDILIVDDEKDIRELISEILIDEGYSTRLAANSTECLNFNHAFAKISRIHAFLSQDRRNTSLSNTF